MKYVDSSKTCAFCSHTDIILDYKNAPALLPFVDYFGKIKKSYYQGTCRVHQHRLANAIKKARHMGLLAFTR